MDEMPMDITEEFADSLNMEALEDAVERDMERFEIEAEAFEALVAAN